MKRADIVDEIKRLMGPVLSRRECAEVVQACLFSIKRSLAAGERVELRGFGVFEVVHRRSRMARNPRTGDAVPVPARNAVLFRPSKDMRALVEELPLADPRAD